MVAGAHKPPDKSRTHQPSRQGRRRSWRIGKEEEPTGAGTQQNGGLEGLRPKGADHPSLGQNPRNQYVANEKPCRGGPTFTSKYDLILAPFRSAPQLRRALPQP